MVKAEKTPLKKGAWSAEEDIKLVNYIKKYKIWNWSEMSKAAGLARSGKSCRLRWMNYLRPDIKHGNFSNEEVETIISLHETIGNRWATIASRLPGRTDNEVKNFWHTHLKKRLIKPSHGNTAPETESGSSKAEFDDDEASPKALSDEESPQFEDTKSIIEDLSSLNPKSTDVLSPSPTVSSLPPPLYFEVSHEQQHKQSPKRVAESPQPMCTDEPSSSTIVSSSAPFVSCEVSHEQPPQSSWAQQQQISVGDYGELNRPDDSPSPATLFGPEALVGPSNDELTWQHESTWTYERFCEDVCNDWLDYMDPIF